MKNKTFLPKLGKPLSERTDNLFSKKPTPRKLLWATLTLGAALAIGYGVRESLFADEGILQNTELMANAEGIQK